MCAEHTPRIFSRLIWIRIIGDNYSTTRENNNINNNNKNKAAISTVIAYNKTKQKTQQEANANEYNAQNNK